MSHRRGDEDGYLFLRGLLDAEAVLATRRAVTQALDAVGWIAAGTEVFDAVPSGRAVREEHNADPAFFVMDTEVQRQQAFHELAHAAEIVRLVGALLDRSVLVHPRKIARAALPKDYGYHTPPHQDFRTIQGTPDVLTVWVPLGACSDEDGGLAVLAGSHRAGLRPVEPAKGPGLKAVGIDGDEPGWVTADYEPGDALVFHSLTVHAAKPNRAYRLRLSADYRYQAIDEPITAASLAPHYARALPGWDELTTGWTATRSVDAPADLRVVELHDFMDPDMPIAASRLVNVAHQPGT